MEELDFHESRLDLAALEKDYEEVSLPTDSDEYRADEEIDDSPGPEE